MYFCRLKIINLKTKTIIRLYLIVLISSKTNYSKINKKDLHNEKRNSPRKLQISCF